MNRLITRLLPPRLRPRSRPPLHPAPLEAPSPLDALIGLSPERAYIASPWVYAAVTRIAEAAALVPLRIYRVTSGERVLLPDHPLLALLNTPNHRISRFELIESTVGMLELGGNAYWYLAGDADGLPAAIHPLAPERVRIVPDAVEGVRGYVYEWDGVRVPLDPLEVVHFRRWHPGSDRYGLSALEAARLAIQADRAMA
ncbi:MAG: phage portal protein, partial [Anaerolinea sp.]|nr:phage portal protein [Anaerolinea sp.]